MEKVMGAFCVCGLSNLAHVQVLWRTLHSASAPTSGGTKTQ